jgi:predicted glycoside hydrolase/deacetylase ChbG (UPF0249 family)
MPRLTITADDYGYSAATSEGILEAARANAVDAVSAMVRRDACDPAPLLELEAEIGLHIELGDSEPDLAGEVRAQAERFSELFERPPSHLDGHLHCHVTASAAPAVEQLARELGIRVRSVDPEHRARLRSAGIETPDALLGRLSETDPVLPEEIAAVDGGGAPPQGWIEWLVHPGLADPAASSRYEEGREEDLRVVLLLARDGNFRDWRAGS